MPSVARPSAPGRSIGPIEPELNQTPLSQHLCCRPEVTFLVNITLGWGLLMKAEDGEKGEGRKDTWSLAGLHSHTGPDLPGAPWDSTLWGSGPPPSPLVPQCELGGAGPERSGLPWTHPCGPDLSPWVPPGLDSEPRSAPAPQGCREPLSTPPAPSHPQHLKPRPALYWGQVETSGVRFSLRSGRWGGRAPLTSIPTCMMF